MSAPWFAVGMLVGLAVVVIAFRIKWFFEDRRWNRENPWYKR